MNNLNELRRNEIWFVNFNYMSDEKSSLQAGLRPAVVVSNDMCNIHSSVVSVIPLSSNLNKMGKVPTHVLVPRSAGLKFDSVALCEQQMSIDKCKLKYKIGECDLDTMSKINEAIMIQNGIKSINVVASEKIEIDYSSKKEEKIEIDYSKVKEIYVAIVQLDKIAKESGKQLSARKILLDDLVNYCKNFGRDYKEVINELKYKLSLNKSKINERELAYA